MSIAALYLLHFNPPLKHARHYLGFVEDHRKLDDRLTQHRTGRGARITAVAIENGIELMLARVWKNGSRKMERRLKNAANAPKLCPICRGNEDEQ